ncbi:endolytic transglycosylase MltG [Nitrosomonas sp. ANs5]|uniref:endolytic transglycosylase MltG n=1 Tax=Nitrosomonas sp. ANs5 TaxID=3423941 RepID=UPI003D3258D6
MPKSIRLARWLGFLLRVILIGSLLLAAWTGFLVISPSRLPAVPYTFSIAPGDSLRGIARQLADEQVIPNAWSFMLLAHVTGNQASIKAGDYELTGNLTPLQLLDYLVQGDVKRHEITFIEGWTFSQFRQTLDEHPAIRHDASGLSELEVLRLIGAHETAAEGLFFPDTYFFRKHSSDIAILKRAYQTMQHHLEAAWLSRQESLPLQNPYEGLILASIIEKETGVESERRMIAGVFVNRLRRGMKLQTDPTVIYGMGDKFDGNLRKADLRTDHPYNTYTRFGLPPAPIAMPGLASIQASLNPASTDALYFVARGDGTSKFSATLAEHNRAVLKYQKNRP